MITIGIDPGITGALALFRDGQLADLADMPVLPRVLGKGNVVNAGALREILTRWGVQSQPAAVYLEYVNAMPGGGERRMGATGAFTFGHAAGVVVGAVQGLNIPLFEVPPARWKAEFGLIRKEKEAARTAATQRWPAFAERFAPKGKGTARADAALIGLYGTMEDILR